MPIMRGPFGATTAFMIPCFGEGIFVVVNTKLNCGASHIGMELVCRS